MVESGVIRTEKGSKAALVYGQMNEPPGASASCSNGVNTSRISAMKSQEFYSSSIISSGLHRQGQRFRHARANSGGRISANPSH